MAGRLRLIGYVIATVLLPSAAISVALTTVLGLGEGTVEVVLIVAGVAAVAAYSSLHVAQRVVGEVTDAMTLRARAIAVGHLQSDPLPVRGIPELVRLGRAFNDMNDVVRSYVRDAEQSQSQLRRSLQQLGTALSGTHDLEAIFDVAAQTARLVSGARSVVVWDLEEDKLVPRVVLGETRVRSVVELGDGLAGRAASRSTTVTGDERSIAEPHHEHAVAVPIVVNGRVRSVLAVYGREGQVNPFSLDDVATLETLARQTETAVDNALLHAEASRLAVTDPLTGLANRRQLDQRIEIEESRAERFGEVFSVVVIDIDDFKHVNDDHTHAVGDAVLVEVGRRLTAITRSVDLVARTGGEEMVVLLPGADVATAAKAAARIRQTVARRPVVVGDLSLPITISAGVATHPDHGPSGEVVLAQADLALYRAKAAGKNRVERAVAPS